MLGEGVRASLFGGQSALGEHVKVNEQWLRVVGVAGPQLSAQTDVERRPGRGSQQHHLRAARHRDPPPGGRAEQAARTRSTASTCSWPRPTRPCPTARVVRGLLNDSHKDAGDFSIIVPAELLAQQRRTQRIFEMVMVAIASISLLVGGIGIMNIMLASILERTKEIGIRRAVGARRRDDHPAVPARSDAHLVRRRPDRRPRRRRPVTPDRLPGRLDDHRHAGSILLAFSVSVAVGLVFGVYPARKAALLDPVESLHYE